VVAGFFDHALWHVFVLAAALLAAAGALILLLGPLVFAPPEPGGGRGRRVAWALVGLGALVVVVEWQLVH
jgi:hypothetical protein